MSADSRIRRAISISDQVDRLLRRIRCQIEFGRAIDDGRFKQALDQAEEASSCARCGEDIAGLQEAIRAAEHMLREVAKEAKTFTIHCVGHGHIDMNWMWSWPETVATTHDTFASVLALMDQYPELTYSQSQASVYALIEKHHPAMFEQIKTRVKEGRWEVAAVHWVEGDKNLASGEALAHHLLYTRRYFQDKFGLAPEDVQLDWEPDTFGHCNTLPGILRQGGVRYYYCCRPGGGQEHLRIGEERPPVFWWQSPDGSRVLVNKETTWYNSYVEIGDNFALPAAAFWKKTGLKDWLNVYGIGNHGGGPTREEIDFFLETRDWACWPKVIFGRAQDWFRKIEPLCADAPVLDHELNYEFTGCYTSQSAIKKANRYGENYCVEAEILSVIGDRKSEIGSRITDDRSLLRDAWINVLFNQFHDILPGSGVAATRNHALGLFQETGAITGAIKRNVLRAIASDLDTASLLPDTSEGADERKLLEARSTVLNPQFQAGAGQGAGESGFSRASGGGSRFRPVMIFNPCAWVRSEMVQVSLYDMPRDIPDDGIVALDETGAVHPTLNVTGTIGGANDWGHRRTDLLFLAKDLPALGYRTFLFCEGAASGSGAEGGVLTLGETEFETPSMRVKLSKYSSGLESLVLKKTNATFTTGYEPLGQWEAGDEAPKGMSAWIISHEAHAWSGLNGFGPSFRVVGARRNEATDLRTGGSFAIMARQKLLVPETKSSVTLQTVLSGEGSRVDWTAEIDWREIGDNERGIPGLRVDFETLLDRDAALYETAFGTVSRPTPDSAFLGNVPEVPSLRFVHGGSTGGGFTLLQDGKYGFGDAGSSLSMRVVRSTYEPDHAPEVAKSNLRYALVFHEKEPTNADLVRLGAAFNHPMIVVPVLMQSGSRQTSRSFAEVQTESVVLSTLKRAEEGDGLILRLVNYADQEVEARVVIAPELVSGFSRAQCVDLMERPAEGQASLREGTATVRIEANSFVTILLSTGAGKAT